MTTKNEQTKGKKQELLVNIEEFLSEMIQQLEPIRQNIEEEAGLELTKTYLGRFIRTLSLWTR